MRPDRFGSSLGRAAGLKLLCALAMGFGVCLGFSLPVPDTIQLPDSLGPLHPDYHLAFGSSTNNIYVASESSDVMVVDGSYGGTFQRIKRINTGPVAGALLVSQHNKLYCSYPKQGRIGIIDCSTNGVVGSIQVGTRPTLLCYSSGSDKLYCGDTIDCTVSVINCATNAVLKVIPVGDSLAAMEYDPTTNKVYAATEVAVQAISCSGDSIVADISAARGSRGFCMNRRRQKLYAIGPRVGMDTLFVISTNRDSVTARMTWFTSFGSDFRPLLACNESTDRLYGISDRGSYQQLQEFDCIGDTITRWRDIGEYFHPWGIVCDTVRNRVYYYYADGYQCFLQTADCSTLDPLCWTQVEDETGELLLDPARRRVLCAGGDPWETVLAVFDCDRDSLTAVGGVPLHGARWELMDPAMCHNPTTSRLYYRWGHGACGVGVIDEQTNRVVRQIMLTQGRGGGVELAYSRTSNRLYCNSSRYLAVLDGTGDSLLRPVGFAEGGSYLSWYPDGNKLYCCACSGSRDYLVVLDCYTDSIIKEIDIYDYPDKLEYVGNGRLLCVQDSRLTLIDCHNDSVLVDSAFTGNVYASSHTGDGKKIYLVRNLRLEVLDASSLSLRTTVEWEYAVNNTSPFLVCSDSLHKLYWFTRDKHAVERDSVLAIDTRSDTVVARLGAGFQQGQGCLDHSGRYIFCPDANDHNSLIVYDARADTVSGSYRGLPCPTYVTLSPEQHCVYVACTDVMLAYPDVPPGVEEAPNAEVRTSNPMPTFARGVLFLPEDTNRKSQAASLLDISGRKVMDLKAGANDVRALAPGVYFVRAVSREPSAVSCYKVVVTR